ncbi:MAG: alpha-ribazole phosphatase [Prevotella sp.]|nr:alpha-ribazole phosphatase [Prevotella sp.]
MDLIMIRHTSVGVPHGTCYGWTDVPVADTFEQEAAETLRNLQPLMPFDRVYTSPLTRAKQLATFCGFPDATQDRRLMEMNMGDWEMQRFEAIDDPRLEEWYDDFMHKQTTNGESFPLFYQRVTAFLDDLRQQPLQRVAIFAHGGVLIAAAIYAGLFPADRHAFSHLVPYGGIQQISI